jgi:YesN/AraC family two-component response regulator
MMNLLLRAFKLSHSIDYLLKPIDEEDLTAAVSKFRAITKTRKNTSTLKKIKECSLILLIRYKRDLR